MKDNAVKTCCKRGFTLIELLVVVLIIGILAAVALPQYNKAVKKAQGTEVLTSLKALDKNFSAYYLEHDSYDGIKTSSFSIEIPTLRHFRYGNSNYNLGTFEFNPQEILIFGRSAEEQASSVSIYISSPDGIYVLATWTYGKIDRLACQPKSGSSVSCADYFNCAATPRVQISSQIGENISYIWDGGDCLLQ